MLYIEYTSLFSTRDVLVVSLYNPQQDVSDQSYGYNDLNPHLNPYMAFNSLSAKCIYIHAFSHNGEPYGSVSEKMKSGYIYIKL